MNPAEHRVSAVERRVSAVERRVLLRLATGRDEALAVELLARSGIEALPCAGMQSLVDTLAQGAGGVMVAEETLDDEALALLARALDAQPPWSDLPVIVLSRQGADSRTLADVLRRLRNVTVIERPVRMAALRSAVEAALRARARQWEVRALLDDLSEADRRKTEFLATLAHELRNPLAPISAALDLLQRGAEPERADALHRMMRRQVDHMVRLVDDLMEVSRITRGKVSLQRAPAVLQRVAADAIEFSRPLVERAGHTLSVQMDAAPIVAQIDAVRLTQVVANLLNNAARYTPAGGRIEVGVTRGDGAVARITVTDNGIGLEPQLVDRVFDMFVQAAQPPGAALGGLGIGLTLVKALVELHGGAITASSQGPGAGSTFVVTLPLEAEAAASPPAPSVALPSHDTAPGTSLSTSLGTAPETPAPRAVLIVDDNRDAADSLAGLLTVLGLHSMAAYTAADALRAVQGTSFDAAVIDLGMPEVDGYELAQRLRGLSAGAPRTLIALSGWGQAADRERASAAGFDAHLVKPADMPRLLALLSPT